MFSVISRRKMLCQFPLVCLFATIPLNMAKAQIQPKSSSKGDSPKGGMNAKVDAPVVLMILMKDYISLNKLTYPVESGIALAGEMEKAGYQITIITDKASEERVKGGLKQTKVKIQGMDDTASVKKEIDIWKSDNFSGKNGNACFGFLIFSGHGEQRAGEINDEEAYFLGVKDKSNEGGINLQRIREDAAKQKLPLFMIVDACRIKSAAAPKAAPDGGEAKSPGDLINQNRGNRFLVYKGLAAKGGLPTIPTFWAASAGEAAADSKDDLLGLLARGLTIENGMYTARNRRHILKDSIPPIESEKDLSIYTWFFYAETELIRLSRMTQKGGFEESVNYLDSRMLVASQSKGKILKNNSVIDILEGWGQFAGGFRGEDVEDGVRISREPKAPFPYYASGHLRESFEAYGKTMYIELIAKYDESVKGKAPPFVEVLIQPNAILDAVNGVAPYLSKDWTTPRKLTLNQPTVFAIPMETGPKNVKLSGMAISARTDVKNWPEGVSVTVTRMKLAGKDIQPGAIPGATAEIDLFSRWWVGDVIKNEKSKAKIDIILGKNKPSAYFNMQVEEIEPNEEVGRGGSVFPPVFVDKSEHRLALNLSDCGLKSNTKVRIT